MRQETLQIEGACHCRNIHYQLRWPGPATSIPIRKCSCTFCRKHAGAWTSHPGAELVTKIEDASSISKYRFGTTTADFYVCSLCGLVPFVFSEIDGNLYAVVNVSTFEDVDISKLDSSATNFDGEDTASRLERRKRNWIPNVRISVAGA